MESAVKIIIVLFAVLFHSHMLGRWYQVRELWQNSFRAFVIFLSQPGIDLFERLFIRSDVVSIQSHGSQHSLTVQKFWSQMPGSHHTSAPLLTKAGGR